jgi:hypothetical protein
MHRPHRLESTQRCRVFFTMLYSLPTTPGSIYCMMCTSRGCAPNRALYLLCSSFLHPARTSIALLSQTVFVSVCGQR